MTTSRRGRLDMPETSPQPAAVRAPRLLLLACALAGCAAPTEPPSAPEVQRTIPVSTALAEAARVDLPVTLTASVQPSRAVAVAAEVGGRVLSVAVERGETVRAGAPLARLERSTPEAQLAQAKAQLAAAEAQAELARTRFGQLSDLLEKAAATPTDHRTAELNLAAAEANVDASHAAVALARENLGRTTLKAPFAGEVAAVMLEQGALVGPGTPAFQLVALDPIELHGGLSAKEVHRVAPDQLARVQIEGEELQGRVARIGPTADPRTRSWPVEIEVPNPQRALLPGMVARVDVVVGSRDDAVVVPEEAVLPGDPPRVFVVAGGVASERVVVLGRTVSEGIVELRDGVRAGEAVATLGKQHLSDGAAVDVVDLPAAEPGG